MTDTSQRAAADWRATVVELEPWLRAFVAGRVGDPQAVSDIVQDVLVVAVSRSGESERILEPQAWLRTIAQRQVALHYRTTERRQRREVMPPEMLFEERTPLKALLQAEDAGLVKQALAKMDDSAAELLRLKYVEQYSYKDIGRRLGMSWNEIAHGLRDARDELRSRLVALVDDGPSPGNDVDGGPKLQRGAMVAAVEFCSAQMCKP